MKETKIYRHFSMGDDPQSQALGLILQKWREGTTTTEYPTEWGAALEFGDTSFSIMRSFAKSERDWNG
jgi:hypothetical protein